MKRFGLPKWQRLTRKRDIDRVFDEGKSFADGSLAVRAAPNGLDFSRIVVSVQAKFGGAVQRNRARRLIKEAFRLNKHELPAGLDFAVLLRRGQVTSEQARQSLHNLLWKAKDAFASQ